jgi:hypothetical protein
VGRRGIDDSRHAAYGVPSLRILILRQLLRLMILLVRFHRADLVEVVDELIPRAWDHIDPYANNPDRS